MIVYTYNEKVCTIKRNKMSVGRDLATGSWCVITWEKHECEVHYILTLTWVEEIQICTGY